MTIIVAITKAIVVTICGFIAFLFIVGFFIGMDDELFFSNIVGNILDKARGIGKSVGGWIVRKVEGDKE